MTTAPVPRRSRALVVSGVVLMIVAVIVTFVGIAGVVDTSINAVDAPRIPVPGERVLPFETGSYAVYAPKPATGQAGIDDLRLGDITVTGPTGADIAVVAIDSKLVVSDGELQWAAVGQFQIDQAGDYRVALGPPAQTTAMVAPTIAEVGTRSVIWVLLSGLGFLSFIIGVVLMFTGVARRAGDRGPGPDGPFGPRPSGPPPSPSSPSPSNN